MCKEFCPDWDKKAIISVKKQGCFRCKSGPLLGKKWPVNFSKACLLHINVNILYRRDLISASPFSISTENPDIFVMTYCRIKALGGLHAVSRQCRLAAVLLYSIFMYPCRMSVVYLSVYVKKQGIGFILQLFMSIFVSRNIRLMTSSLCVFV